MTGRNASAQQRMIALGLPLVFTPIMIGFPAGLLVYWISTNVWTMGQQAVVKVFFPQAAPPTPEEIEAKTATSAGPPRRLRLPRARRSGAGSGPSRSGVRLRPVAEGDASEASRGAGRARPGSCSSGSSTSSASTPSVSVEEDDGEIRGSVDGRGGRPADRPPRPDDRRRAAALLPDRLPRLPGPQAGHRRRRRLPRAPERGAVPPRRHRRRGRDPRRPRDRAGADGLERAPGRARAPARPHRGRDLQRGRRAPPLRRRRSAAGRPTELPAEPPSSRRCWSCFAPTRAPRSPGPTIPNGARRPHRRLAQRPRARAAAVAAAGSPTSAPARACPGWCSPPTLPDARVDLIESVGAQVRVHRGARSSGMGLANAAVVCERSEDLGAGPGREAYDAVTARAVGRLATLAELASPLLRDGGCLVAWKGRRDARGGGRARPARPVASRWSRSRSAPCTPYPGSRDRHIHLLRKNGPTPNELPRRTVWRRSVRSGPNESTRRTRALMGDRLRDREPEGRGRQDDHRGQHGRLRRAATAARRCSSTSTPSATPRWRSGLDKDQTPSSYDCLTGEVSVAEAARPAGPRQPLDRPRQRATSPAPRSSCRAPTTYETRLRDGLGPVRERFAYTLLDCPPSLGPGHRQRPGRGGPRDRPRPGRVPGARGAGPVPRHAEADPPRAQPVAGPGGGRDHDARRAHAPLPGRRAGAARASAGPGLQDGDPAEHPRRRGAELRDPRRPARPEVSPGRRPTRRSRKRSRLVAERKRGMGRGLAAILPESGAGGPELRELAGRDDRAQPRPAPHQLRDGRPRRPGRLDQVGRGPAAADRAPHSTAAATSWSPASAAGGPRRRRAWTRVPAVIRVSPEDERLQAALIENMVREDLNAGRGGPRLRRAGRRPRHLQGGAGPARGSQPRGDLEPDPPARPARPGARAAGARRAQRGPRPRDPPGHRPGLPRAARQAGRRRRAGRSARPRTGPAPDRRARARRLRRRAAASAPRSAPRWPTPRTPWARPSGADVRVRRAGDGVKAELRFDDLDEVETLAKRLRRRS